MLLAGPGVERGLLGPREAGRIWERHVLNCAVAAELVPPAARVADVGSGAGLPGIVLAIARPDLRMDLIEPLLRRVRFLAEVVADLRLANVGVLRGRAETHAARGAYDCVVARAVAPLERLAAWAAPLLCPGGALLAWKGETAAAELTAARTALAGFGLADAGLRTLGRGVVEPPVTVIVARRAGTRRAPARARSPR